MGPVSIVSAGKLFFLILFFNVFFCQSDSVKSEYTYMYFSNFRQFERLFIFFSIHEINLVCTCNSTAGRQLELNSYFLIVGY